MRYEILGSLRVRGDKSWSFISARNMETMLAVLLVRADQVVSYDQLIAELWGGQPPRRATAGLHVCVSQLRKFLGQGSPSEENPIVTRPPVGYVLRLARDELDVHVFQRQVSEGRAELTAGRLTEAHDHLDNAMSLFRGPVLDGLSRGPILGGFISWMTESRLECLEMLMDTRLRLGRHREVVGSLHSLVAEHPLREAFHYQLMLALYRSKLTAEALRVFQQARRTLRDELGLEPSRALHDLHHAILQADRQLDLDHPQQSSLVGSPAGR